MADENPPQNKTPLRRPVRPIPQQEEERVERISKVAGWCMVGTAAFIDLFEAILDLLAIGAVLNSIISVCADLGFIIWFWTKGVTFVKKPKNLATMGIQALVGLIPGANILPELTTAVYILVKLTQSEDKGGLLGKAAGAASGKAGSVSRFSKISQVAQRLRPAGTTLGQPEQYGGNTQDEYEDTNEEGRGMGAPTEKPRENISEEEGVYGSNNVLDLRGVSAGAGSTPAHQTPLVNASIPTTKESRELETGHRRSVENVDVGESNLRPKIETLSISQEEDLEEKEKRELEEYLEKEVFSKFNLTKEDEARALAEVSENKREILTRSFENTRNSLSSLYEMETIEGRVDGHAFDRAKKQLEYDTLAPILENHVAEIQPKLSELGIEISLSSLDFTPETADRNDLYDRLTKINNQLNLTIRKQVEKKMETALSRDGEYRGITLPTNEQLSDEVFMEQRGQLISKTINEEARTMENVVGFGEWESQAKQKLEKPFKLTSDKSRGPIQQVNSNDFRVKKSREEITELLEAEKIRAEQTGFLCVNITAAKLETILTKGGFKDIFALNEKELEEMRRTRETGDNSYMDQRKTIEQALGVYSPESSTVYGTYSSNNDNDERRGGAAFYGNIFLKLKPSTEAVFCEGDSMSRGNEIADNKLNMLGIKNLDYANHAKARQIAPEQINLVKAMSNTFKKIENSLGKSVSVMGYTEAHIKGLRLEDIESINIPKFVLNNYLLSLGDEGDYIGFIEKLQ